MKNRIMAVFLAFTVLLGSLSITKRAHGIAAVSWIITIGIAAWECLDIMIKGEEPAIIDAIRTLIEEGVDALTNPDSHFQQTYGAFWKDYGESWGQVNVKLTEWYENGDLPFKNGGFELAYSQFNELFNLVVNYVSNIGANFTTPYSYFGFEYTPGFMLSVKELPTTDIYSLSEVGQSYALCFYDDNKAIFSDNFAVLKESYSSPVRLMFSGRYLYNNYSYNSNDAGISIFDDAYDRVKAHFGYPSLSEFYFTWVPVGSTQEFSIACPAYGCFVFENGEMKYSNISSVDISGCQPIIISTTGDYGAFLQSITALTVSEPVAAELDDLSNVLPVDDSPVLSIPTSPDLSIPIPEQVSVSVPGAKDIPLSEYMDPLITDIKAPSGLANKFPFCIPFDFIRFLGVLAADPIPPVFHIPISTHPANLQGFVDNETIGDFVAPDDPMFEINEEIVIDFAHIPLVQAVCYTIFLVGFVLLLIKLTPKLIQH